MTRHESCPPLTAAQQAVCAEHLKLARWIAGPWMVKYRFAAEEFESEAVLALTLAVADAGDCRPVGWSLASHLRRAILWRLQDHERRVLLRLRRDRGAADATPPERRPARAADVAARAADVEQVGRLLAGLRGRSPAQAEALRLAYLEGLDRGELAARLGISRKYANRLIRRGLAALAAAAAEEDSAAPAGAAAA